MFFLVPTAFAQSASGGFHVVTDEGTRNIEFNAKLNPNGSASGDLKFTGPLSVPDQDVDGDGTGDPSATATTLSLRVDVDCLKVEGNRAALAGLVKESSVSAYVGRRMLLTVEDGGEGAECRAGSLHVGPVPLDGRNLGCERRGAGIRSGCRPDVDRHRLRAD